MKCPICGCKMPNKSICVYCKITGEQVENASNIKAKKAIKDGNKKDICYTTVMPNDVNRTKLLLLTILLGFVGAGNFYVGKRYKGLFCLISWILFLPFGITSLALEQRIFIVQLMYEIGLVLATVTIFMWIVDIILLITKSYKVPVILGENKK